MELLRFRAACCLRARFASSDLCGSPAISARSAGRASCVSFPTKRALSNEAAGTPLPDSRSELPPVIRRAEVVAFALVALLVICIVAVLYVAKAFFLPVMTAFVVGTMLSPAAGYLERHRIPRAVVRGPDRGAVGAVVAFIVGLISSPLMRMEHAAAGAGIAAEGQAACVRPAARCCGRSCRACSADPTRFRPRRSRCRNSTGCSRRSNSCRRPSPSSCCSSRPWSCSSRAGGTCAAR